MFLDTQLMRLYTVWRWMKMNLTQFEAEFSKLGNNYKTKDVDRFNRALIKRHEDVSFLRDIVLAKQEYHRTYFQVSLAQKNVLEEKLGFIEENFDKLQDWWHVDQLSQFIDKYLSFDYAYEKAKKYIESDMTFARRWGYVIFMPSLVKDVNVADKLFAIFKDDDEYYVQMAEAWLISYLGIYAPEKTLEYLKECPLKYNIAGKAIQKICDSFRVNNEWKARFREVRKMYK